MRVLLILNHAPSYREAFLRHLAAQCELTVCARPCCEENLPAPTRRLGYAYHEIAARKCFGLKWASISSVLKWDDFDLVCASLNLRCLYIVVPFLMHVKRRKHWIWWGHIYGQSKSHLLMLVRSYLLKRAAAALVHSVEIQERVQSEHSRLNVASFNNTQAEKRAFRELAWPPKGVCRLLFVGRPTSHKRLERLIRLAQRRKDVEIRLVGPSMLSAVERLDTNVSGNVEIFGATHGEGLVEHFGWCNAVVSPGHLGLLVINAAQHARPIIVDCRARHAPEIVVAREARQWFIDFSSEEEVDHFISKLKDQPEVFESLGRVLQSTALNSFTVESMVETHLQMFSRILMRNSDAPQ